MHAGILALSLVLSQVPGVQVLCDPSGGNVVCYCKRGSPSACAAPADGDAEALKGSPRVPAAVKAADEVQKATNSVDTGCGASQSPSDDDDKAKCTGQLHHIISKTVWRALDRHRVLRGLYRYRDPRFVARAKDLKAHCGWEKWHRKIDDEIADWVRVHDEATPQEVEAYLRFPNGF